MVLVTLIDRNRQWFKSRLNFDVKQTGRAESFAAWTLLPKKPKVLLVKNAETDPRFRENPLVVGQPRIRFYAGTPLVVDGHRVGSLCLVDFVAREDFDVEAVRLLNSFGDMTTAMLSLPAHHMWMLEAMDTIREGIFLLDFELEDAKENTPDEASAAGDRRGDGEGRGGGGGGEEAVEALSRGLRGVMTLAEGDLRSPVAATRQPRGEASAASEADDPDVTVSPSDADRTGTLIFANNALKRMLGPDKCASLPGKTLLEIFDEGPPETTDKLRSAQTKLTKSARRRFEKLVESIEEGSNPVDTPSTVRSQRSSMASSTDRTVSSSSCQEAEGNAAENESDGCSGGAGGVVESAFELLRNDAFEDTVSEVRMDITVDLHAGRRRVSLSLNYLPVEKAAFKHVVGPEEAFGLGLGSVAHCEPFFFCDGSASLERLMRATCDVKIARSYILVASQLARGNVRVMFFKKTLDA